MSTAGAVGRKTVGRITRVIFGAAVTAAVLIGCGEKPDDDLVGDWSIVEIRSEDDGDVYVEKTPDDEKHFFTFTASGDMITTQLTKYVDFWLENIISEKYILKGNSICVDGECAQYSISGSTLTLSFESGHYHDDGEYHSQSARMTAVSANIASVKRSLGNSLKSQNSALSRTEWTKPSESGSYYGDYIAFWESDFYDSDDIYLSGYYDETIWYTENSRLFLVGLVCSRYKTVYEDGYELESHCSIAETVTLDYRLSDGNKTLSLRPAGSSGEWDVWTLDDDDDYYYSQPKSRAKFQKSGRSVSPFFQAFGGRR